MKSRILVILTMFLSAISFAQQKTQFVHPETNDPISGAAVTNQRTKTTATSDENGWVTIQGALSDTIVIKHPNFGTNRVVLENLSSPYVLQEKMQEFEMITIIRVDKPDYKVGKLPIRNLDAPRRLTLWEKNSLNNETFLTWEVQ